MEPLIRAVGIALVAVISLMLLRGLGSGFSPLIRIVAVLLLFGLVVLELSESVQALNVMFSSLDGLDPTVKKVIGVMLKALGIALIGKICADVCRECGENGIAQGVESVAGIVIFSLSLPILGEILEFAATILGKVSE